MPFLDQIVIASSATQHGQTWDLVGASWDVLRPPTLPVQIDFALLISVLMSREEARETHGLSVTLTDSDGAVLGAISAAVPASADERLDTQTEVEHIRAESVLAARGVVFPAYGRYELSILWDDEPLRQPMRLYVLRPNAAEGGE